MKRYVRLFEDFNPDDFLRDFGVDQFYGDFKKELIRLTRDKGMSTETNKYFHINQSTVINSDTANSCSFTTITTLDWKQAVIDHNWHQNADLLAEISNDIKGDLNIIWKYDIREMPFSRSKYLQIGTCHKSVYRKAPKDSNRVIQYKIECKTYHPDFKQFKESVKYDDVTCKENKTLAIRDMFKDEFNADHKIEVIDDFIADLDNTLVNKWIIFNKKKEYYDDDVHP